jgi:uncharacterized membrane protein
MLPPPARQANPLARTTASVHNDEQRRKRTPTSMNIKNVTIAAAIGSLLAVGAANADQDPGKDDKVMCYGVAKAGKNDCATASHSCAGASKKDNDPAEWKYLPRAECEKAGGKVVSSDQKPM